jgi:hypothetical protein
MTLRYLSFAAAAFALSVTAPALAHHGWGGYQNNESDVTGTVESVSLGGPHASLKVKGADGKTWDVVLSPPYTTFNAGIKEGTIPVGATVTAHGHRHRDMNKFEIKTEQLTMGEKTFNVYPGRD